MSSDIICYDRVNNQSLLADVTLICYYNYYILTLYYTIDSQMSNCWIKAYSFLLLTREKIYFGRKIDTRLFELLVFQKTIIMPKLLKYLNKDNVLY